MPELLPGSADPLPHVRKMCLRLEDARNHLCHDLEAVEDPLFKRMFGEASSVLDRLIAAFRIYEIQATKGKRT